MRIVDPRYKFCAALVAATTALLIIFGPLLELQAQAPSSDAQESYKKAHEERVHQMHENNLLQLKPELDAYHQGKLSDADGFIIMYRMMGEYGVLGLKDSPEAQMLS